jgi:hypothetical protein
MKRDCGSRPGEPRIRRIGGLSLVCGSGWRAAVGIFRHHERCPIHVATLVRNQPGANMLESGSRDPGALMY